MKSVTSIHSSENGQEIGKIKGIPIRNLWFLMFYASGLYKDLENGLIDAEDYPDDIPDLVAKVLCKQVERRIRRNLSSGYMYKESILDRVRGRIDLLKTERYQLLQRGKIACQYDEMTVDTFRNRFVRDALEKISIIVKNVELAHECRILAKKLRRMRVTGERPNRSLISYQRVGIHDKDDRPMIDAAILAFDLALLTEFAGSKSSPKPERDSRFVEKLFEAGIRGFFHSTLPHESWKMKNTEIQLNWQMEDQSSGIVDFFPPTMKADIIIDDYRNSVYPKRIVIDTKFSALLTEDKREYIKENKKYKFSRNHIYQIYAYLRSQEGKGKLENNAIGMLLHPSIEEPIYESVTIQNHEIRFATVDLSDTNENIRNRLLHLIEKC